MGRNIFNECPIFIGGHRRSGTSLFIALLDGHPQLAAFPVDSGFFYGYFPIYEDSKYSNKDRVERIIEFCYSNFKELVDKCDPQGECGFSFEKLCSCFREKASQTNFSSKEMLVTMVSAYQEAVEGKDVNNRRLVEKTSSSEIYANYIFEWFPQAQFIHIIRDPRDNYASLKSGWEVRYKYRNDDPRWLLQSMLERGRLGMQLARQNLKRYGAQRYLIVKFEELIANPRKEMERVCNFLKLEYNECLLSPSIMERLWAGNSFEGRQFNGLSSVNVGRWKERISEYEAKVLEYYFAEIMPDFGYPLHFGLNECIDAAVEHYKWYNYSKRYDA